MLRFSTLCSFNVARLPKVRFDIRSFCASEKWLPIKGYLNYQVSSLGRFKNTKSDKILKINYALFKSKGIRPRVNLFCNGKGKRFNPARLLLLTFDPIQNASEMQVNHIDGDWCNDNLDNLEWMTPKQNMLHSFKIGSGKCGATPAIMTDVKSGKIHQFDTLSECMNFYNQVGTKKVCNSTITTWCQQRCIRDGYQFHYANENRYIFKIPSYPGEQWKTCHAGKYNTKYLISNEGRVKVVYKSGKERLKIPTMRSGYLSMSLDRKQLLLHRLVAKVFIENPNDYPIVEHIDGNIHNYKANNLRWATQKQNMNNPITIQRRRDFWSNSYQFMLN